MKTNPAGRFPDLKAQELHAAGVTTNNLKTAINRMTAADKRYWNSNQKSLHTALAAIESQLIETANRAKARKQAQLLGISQKQLKAARANAQRLARHLDPEYSMGSARRIHATRGKKSVCIGIYSDCQDYAKSCTYRPTWGQVDLSLHINQLLRLEFIGGLPTIPAGDAKIRPCQTIIQSGSKNHYTITLKPGFVTGDHHADSYAAAQAWRADQAGRLIAARRKRATLQTLTQTRFVGLDHSTRAGNCREGSLQFARRHNLNPDFGYRLDYILNLEDNHFTRRIIDLFDHA
jgi:hypothetical protein